MPVLTPAKKRCLEPENIILEQATIKRCRPAPCSPMVVPPVTLGQHEHREAEHEQLCDSLQPPSLQDDGRHLNMRDKQPLVPTAMHSRQKRTVAQAEEPSAWGADAGVDIGRKRACKVCWACILFAGFFRDVLCVWEIHGPSFQSGNWQQAGRLRCLQPRCAVQGATQQPPAAVALHIHGWDGAPAQDSEAMDLDEVEVQCAPATAAVQALDAAVVCCAPVTGVSTNCAAVVTHGAQACALQHQQQQHRERPVPAFMSTVGCVQWQLPDTHEQHYLPAKAVVCF
jgi:hypothetical protein